MSRAPVLTPETMNDAQREVHQEIVSGPHGHIAGPYNAWLQCPELARRARGLSEFIRFNSSLPKRLTELVILVTGRFWKAEFEFYAHAKLAKKAGLDEGIISDIAQGKRPSFQNADEKAVYDMCVELYETRRVGDEKFGRAAEALGLPAVVEVVATAGYYSMVSMTLNAFQVSLPPGESSPFPD